MTYVDGGGSIVPAKVYIVSREGCVLMFDRCHFAWDSPNLRISSDHTKLVDLLFEEEAVVLHKPHDSPTTIAGIRDTILRHPRVHGQPIGETMAPFPAVTVEIDGIAAAQLGDRHVHHACYNAVRHRLIQQFDISSGHISRFTSIEGFIPAGRSLFDQCNAVLP